MPCATDHQDFTDLLPTIQRKAEGHFHTLPVLDREEAVAETIVGAFDRYLSFVERSIQVLPGKGKPGQPTARTLASFSAANVASGRRFMFTDAERLEEVCVATRSQADPASIAAWHIDWRHLDFQTIGQACSAQERQVLNLLARGERPIEIAEILKVSPPRVTAIKASLARKAMAMGYGP